MVDTSQFCHSLHEYYRALVALSDSYQSAGISNEERKKIRAQYLNHIDAPLLEYGFLKLNFKWFTVLRHQLDTLLEKNSGPRDSFLLTIALSHMQRRHPHLRYNEVAFFPRLIDEASTLLLSDYRRHMKFDDPSTPIMPDFIIGNFTLTDMDNSLETYSFPKIVYGNFSFSTEAAKHLLLPEIIIGNSAHLQQLKYAGTITCPKIMSHEMVFAKLTHAESIILPEYTSGSIRLVHLESVRNLQLPRYCAGGLYLSSLPWEFVQKIDFSTYKTKDFITMRQLTVENITQLQKKYPHLASAFKKD